MSAEQLLEQAISWAERLNPRLNAIITPLHDYARQQIANGLPDGPFTGVPFLMKDLITELAGTAMQSGSKALAHYQSGTDSELTQRYKSSGVVIFGKTNTPEFGLMGVTEPKAFGATRNPGNLEHGPGGSGGGSVAAIAAGIVPMASGGDGGGSIRIPAACCGLFGLKPSRGRTPTGPYYSEFWDGAAVEHVLTRSVRDSAALLDVTAGPDGSTPSPVAARHDFLPLSHEPVRPLKIGFSSRSFVDRPVVTQAIKAVEHSAALLQALGHQVEEVDIQLDAEALVDASLTMYFGHVAADLDPVDQTIYRPIRNVNV